ncbi:MAG: cupin domain-containing protein [Bacillota bacterium]|nr:cupin domain-containing protein [Bacillota bacterium]
MSERVRVSERERDSSNEDTYEVVMRKRKEFCESQLMGKVVIKDSDREWEMSRQGRLKYYLQPHKFSDAALRDWQVFTHDIRRHSGSHRHQGGLIIFVIEGTGYTIEDGVRYDWEEGDLLLLAFKPDGVEHQHFNLDPGKPCKWIAFIFWPYWDQLASEMTQGELSPDFKPR